MSNIIDKAKNHFALKLSGSLKKIEVPEWGEKNKPLEIYYKASLNFKQQELILSLADQNKKAEAIVESLIQRSLDEDGNKLFRSSDRIDLMRHCDPDIISEIVRKMGENEEESYEEIEKK